MTGPTTGLSNPCLDTQHLLCLVMYCSRGGEIVGGEGRQTPSRRLVRVKHTRLSRRCRRLRLLVGPTEVRGTAIAIDDY